MKLSFRWLVHIEKCTPCLFYTTKKSTHNAGFILSLWAEGKAKEYDPWLVVCWYFQNFNKLKYSRWYTILYHTHLKHTHNYKKSASGKLTPKKKTRKFARRKFTFKNVFAFGRRVRATPAEYGFLDKVELVVREPKIYMKTLKRRK